MQVTHLECSRGERPLFSGLDFSLSIGEMLWIKGPNGSGKTTLLRALCGLFPPTNGKITWNGQDTRQLGDDFHRDVLYLGHLNGIKHELTVLENIEYNLALNGLQFDLSTIKKAIEHVGLEQYYHQPCGHLSQGQKRRVSLARLLLNQSSLWVLDEPFVALDIAAVDRLIDTMQTHLNNQGRIILTTHQEVPLEGITVKTIKLGTR